MKKKSSTAADAENPAWSKRDFTRAVTFQELPKSLQKKLRGRPKAEVTKERITIRLSQDVLTKFRATGAGWQTRIDAVLNDWLKHGSNG